MKKIIGVLGIVMVAMAISFNTDFANSATLDLAKLIEINTANAESDEECYEPTEDNCINLATWEVVGQYTYCPKGSSSCVETDC